MCLCIFAAPLLCLFWLTKHAVDSVMLSAPEVVTGVYGGSVTVACQYDSAYRDYTKYWCKGEVYELCKIVVKTPRMRHSDRTSITDDKEAGVFTVTVTSLQESDKDLYWCVIARHGRNINTGVRLRVFQTGTVQTLYLTCRLTSTKIMFFCIIAMFFMSVKFLVLFLCC